MTVLTEAVHPGAYLISEARGLRSREEVYIEESTTVVAGQVLGRTVNEGTAPTTPRATAVANAANAGNATLALDATEPVQPGAQDGVYQVVCAVAGTTTAEWEVFDPQGILIGHVADAATFNDQIKFVPTHGGTASVVGDSFQVTVGKEAIGAVVAAALGNTGNGAFTLDATNPVNFATAQPGVYKAICTAVATNAGTFTVYDPNGTSLGTVTVGGSAFNTQIKFTIGDGSEDFVLDDEFDIAVSINEVERDLYAPLNLTATDGTQNAAGVAMYPITTGASSPAPTTAHVRDCEVRFADLTWPTGITANQQAVAIEQLRQAGIICR